MPLSFSRGADSSFYRRSLENYRRPYPHMADDTEAAIQDAIARLQANQRPGDRIPLGIPEEVRKIRAKSTDMRRGQSGGFRPVP